MKGKIELLPGTPDDNNRDYLPEAIKDSDLVVNENGNNSHPYPARLVEYNEVIMPDGEPDVWCEYVPATYDPSKKTPLVVSFHGGMMTGWGQCIYTSWSHVADREGIIIVYPNGHSRRSWTMVKDSAFGPGGQMISKNAPATIEENRDANFALALIEHMKKKYNIDEGRIYIQGMSMGGMMSSQMARYHSGVFAGYSDAGAPTNSMILYDSEGRIKQVSDPLPYMMCMPELNGWDKDPDKCFDQRKDVRAALRYWATYNGCKSLPEIKIIGEDNFMFFRGENCDMVFREIKNRDHGQTLDDAEIVWNYLFSGTRRNLDGSIAQTEPNIPRTGDEFGIAIVLGKKNALVNSKPVEMAAPAILHQKLKYHGLDGGEVVRGEYFCVPVSFVAKVFGAECTVWNGGKSAELHLKDGRTLQFALGSIGCVVNNVIHSMDCEAIWRNEQLYIPFEWICRRLLNLTASRCNDALYVTDHYAELGMHTAMLMGDILNIIESK